MTGSLVIRLVFRKRLKLSVLTVTETLTISLRPWCGSCRGYCVLRQILSKRTFKEI